MRMKNAYKVSAREVSPGDIYAFTITCHVMFDGSLRLYRCPFPNESDLYDEQGNSIPQGSPLPHDATLRDIFPTIFFSWQMNNESGENDNG